MLDINELGGIHEFQMDWFNLAESAVNTIIEAPSSSSKTEIMGVCYPLWYLYTKNKKIEILLISKTISQAQGNLLDRIKDKILDNEILKKALVPQDKRVSWNQSGIKTVNGSTAKNVPYNVNIKGYRAHLIICDEADSYEDVSIYFNHVTSRPHPGGKIVLITTPEGTTKLVGQLKEKVSTSPEFSDYKIMKTTSLRFKKTGKFVTDKDISDIEDFNQLIKKDLIEPLWKENDNFSFKKLKQKFLLGKYTFFQNYLCVIIGEAEDAAFPLEAIVYSYDHKDSFSYTLDQEAKYFIGADFAISDGPRADYDAYVVVEMKDDIYKIKKIETYKGLQRPAKIARLKWLYDNYYSRRGTMIIADESNMGTMVMNDLRSMGVTVIPQKFSGVARFDLINKLSNVFQAKGSIIIPKNPQKENENRLVNEMQQQLMGFKRSKTEKGNETFLSKARHDDIAISLAMAIGEATRYKSTYVKPLYR
ncbi:MAG: phage terminase large subunit family protein [Candidatus Njordarchaeales archaeon]